MQTINNQIGNNTIDHDSLSKNNSFLQDNLANTINTNTLSNEQGNVTLTSAIGLHSEKRKGSQHVHIIKKTPDKIND